MLWNKLYVSTFLNMNYMCVHLCIPQGPLIHWSLTFVLCQTTSNLTCFCPRWHLSTRLTTPFHSFFITNKFLRTVYFNHNFLRISSKPSVSFHHFCLDYHSHLQDLLPKISCLSCSPTYCFTGLKHIIPFHQAVSFPYYGMESKSQNLELKALQTINCSPLFQQLPFVA